MGMMSRPGPLGPVAATEADWWNRKPARRSLRQVCPPSCHTHSIPRTHIQLWECNVLLPCTDVLPRADEGRGRGLALGPALLAARLRLSLWTHTTAPIPTPPWLETSALSRHPCLVSYAIPVPALRPKPRE